MSQFENKAFPLNLKMDIESEFQKLSVFDGKNNLVHQKIGKLDEIELPKGLYRVEVELTGQTKSNIVRHVDNKPHEIELPKSYSSIPLEGYSSSHDYYIDTASKFSREVTSSPKRIITSGDNSLFIFFRFSNLKSFKKHKTKKWYNGFSLLSTEKKHISSLNDDNCFIDKTHGSLSFCIQLPSGQYYLRYSGDKHREIPIFIHLNWQTQLFMTFTTKPLFSSIKLLMNSPMGFDADSEYNKSIDSGFLKLQNGDYQISKELRNRFAYDKWSNPIMGIIGVYLYLMSGESNDNQLYNTIMNNLVNQIHLDPDSPDIKILRLMSDEHHGNTIGDVQFIHPPMFLSGYKEIINRSIKTSNLIKRNSPIDKYSAKLFWDSPITSYSYEPEIKYSQVSKDKANNIVSPTKLSTILAYLKQKARQPKSVGKIKINTDLDWVVPSIFESAISREDSEQRISIEEIAKDLKLPQITVKRNISNLLDGMNQSSDTALKVFDMLNTMTSQQLKDSKSVMDFLAKLNDKDISDEIRLSGILHVDRKKKL